MASAKKRKKKVLSSSEFKASIRKKVSDQAKAQRISNLSQKAQEILKRTNAAIKANQTRRWKKKVAILEAKRKLTTPTAIHRSYSD